MKESCKNCIINDISESGEKMNDFKLNNEYITLGQFLKEIGEISTGGSAKWYLQEEIVKVNDQIENRRGRKLYKDDQVVLSNGSTWKITI